MGKPRSFVNSSLLTDHRRANGITECPIPPGATRRYTWQATQHGTTWYHSHHASQYGDGVLGPILIHGPAAVEYDIGLGVLPISDLYHQSIYEEGLYADNSTPNPNPNESPGPPKADNGLINGTNVGINGTGGSYAKVFIEAGKKYRLRLVNTAVDNHFRVSLDGHAFTVIQSDFVPIVPYDTNWLFLAIGERYDVVFTASEAPANYWFRAEVQAGCGANFNNDNIRAIFNYADVPVANPTSTATNYTVSCADESPENLVRYVAKSVPEDEFRKSYASNAAIDTLAVGLSTNARNIFYWDINK
jgi:FtsP/CotA-like multicopper oxidase with cupredoxin domain